MTYLSPKQLAARWQCSARHIRRLLAEHQLTGLRVGASWRIAEEAALSYEAAHTTSAETAQPAPKQEEVRAPVMLDGFVLPKDYSPVFPDLWPLHETKKSLSRG